MNTTWGAISDFRDDTASGGYRRTHLAKRVARVEADATVHEAARQHAEDAGHTLGAPMVFPGKTFIRCGCGATFHATGLAD